MKNLLLAVLLLSSIPAMAESRYIRGLRVTVAPPPLKHEVPPPAPSARHQWIAGYWAWRGNQHVWLGGHWALPPSAGYAWEPARWEEQNGAWVFAEGHWRTTEEPDAAQVYQPPPPPVQDVVVETAPPPAIEEVRPAAPFAGAAWIPGYWHWSGGRHVWVAGRYSAQPAGFTWEAHKWDKRKDGKWVQAPGHWRRR